MKRLLQPSSVASGAMLVALLASSSVFAQDPAPAAQPAATVSAATVAKPAPALIDRVVAVVNKSVITLNELNDRVKSVSRNFVLQKIPSPPEHVLQQQVLDRLIMEDVQLQLANDTGIRVDDQQLDRALERIAQQNKLPLSEFRKRVEADGESFKQFREEVRNEIILSRLREREVDSKVQVSDAEVENQLKLQSGKTDDQEFNLAHILVQIPENATTEQIQQRLARAEKALAELDKGANFAQVAASFSDAQDALQGGALGWRPANRLPAAFVDALDHLKPGDNSRIMRSSNGFHILKLIDKREKSQQTIIEQTHARHILIRTNEAVSVQDARNTILKIEDRLKQGARFEDLARLYSEDGTAANGGDLGWLSPGDTVPEFDQAMNALKAGDVSAPIQTQFGWHLIKVEARRNQDVSADREKLQVRQAIRARKADEAYEDWVRQQRDQAYVEIKLDEQ